VPARLPTSPTSTLRRSRSASASYYRGRVTAAVPGGRFRAGRGGARPARAQPPPELAPCSASAAKSRPTRSSHTIEPALRRAGALDYYAFVSIEFAADKRDLLCCGRSGNRRGRCATRGLYPATSRRACCDLHGEQLSRAVTCCTSCVRSDRSTRLSAVLLWSLAFLARRATDSELRLRRGCSRPFDAPYFRFALLLGGLSCSAPVSLARSSILVYYRRFGRCLLRTRTLEAKHEYALYGDPTPIRGRHPADLSPADIAAAGLRAPRFSPFDAAAFGPAVAAPRWFAGQRIRSGPTPLGHGEVQMAQPRLWLPWRGASGRARLAEPPRPRRLVPPPRLGQRRRAARARRVSISRGLGAAPCSRVDRCRSAR